MTSNPQLLISGYFENGLSDVQFAELCAWIKVDAANAREFLTHRVALDHIRARFAWADLNDVATDLPDPGAGPLNLDLVGRLLAVETDSDSELTDLTDELRRRGTATEVRQPRSLTPAVDAAPPLRAIVIPRPLFYGAVAAVLLLATWVTLRLVPESSPSVTPAPTVALPPEPHEAEPMIVAHLVESVDAQWEGASIDVGGPLEAEHYHLINGFARIAFIDGASVLVEAPASFRLDSESSMRLEVGRLVGRCPTEQSRGFTVRTPGARIVDLGTEFGVEVSAHAATVTRVFEGRVAVSGAGRNGRRDIERNVLAGQAVRIDESGEHLEAVNPEAFAFIRSTDEVAQWRKVLYRPAISPTINYLDEPVASLRLHALEDDERCVLLLESTSVPLTSNVPIVSSDAGAGSLVDSYLVHFDPAGAGPLPGGNHHVVCEIDFGRPILAVMVESNQLYETDAHYGAAGVDYGSADQSQILHATANRGLDFQSLPPLRDGYVLGANGTSIRIDLYAGGYFDQMRVLVEAKRF